MSKGKLPKGWVEVSLGDAFKIERGGSPRPIQDYLTDRIDGINWIKIGDTSTESKYITFAKEKIIPEGAQKSRMVYEGDFLLSNSMSFGRPYISKINGCIHDGWLVIRKNDKVENDYLYYVLKSPICYHQFSSLAKGSTVKNLNIQAVKKVVIPLPSLYEQQRIVARLDAIFGHLDVLKEKLDRIPELLKNFRQQVLTQAVTGELTKEWREGKGLGEWETRKMNDLILKIEAGKNFTAPEIPVSDGKVGLVKISAVTWGEFDENETKTVENEDQINPNYFIQKGDFLISRANTLELVGSSVIVKKINHQIMLSDKVWRVHFKNQTTKWFVHRFLKSPFGRKEIESRATGNQLSMRNLSQNNFKEIDIEFPPIEEQEEIVKRIDSLFNIADKIETQYQSLKAKTDQMPQAILAKAFRGELVGQDVKEYVREIEELGMVAEGVKSFEVSKTSKV
jgi:type I restriction enzyme S subunit